MSRRKKTKRMRSTELPDAGNFADGNSHFFEPTDQEIHWPKTHRRIATLVIAGYLFVLLMGPLSNPVASPYLSGPIAAKLSPIHRAFFLGHGYRFFGPDPGPSHLLVFKGNRADGTTFEGVFPDRKKNWPRLLYHRWFMLSETIFNENATLPSPEQFNSQLEAYQLQIEGRQKLGQLKLATQLQHERDAGIQQYRTARQRVEVLGGAVAQELLRRNDGDSIELFVQVRELPLAEEVASGMKLEDPSLLSEWLPIGRLDSSGYQIISPSSSESETNQPPPIVNPFPVTMPSTEESR